MTCTGLEGTLVIPSNVTEIGSRAFEGCKKLEGLNLDNATSLTKIGSKAFYNCTGLTGTLVIPSNVEVGESAFSGCNLTIEN